MQERLDVRREYTNRAIENKALLCWLRFNDNANSAPDLYKSQHLFLLEPHMYGAGCCGWRRYYVLRSARSVLAVFSVSRLTSTSPQLHKRNTVPSGLFEGKAISLNQFYAWEAEWEKLVAERHAGADAEARKPVQEVARPESQPSLATIFQTAFASLSAAPTASDDELDEVLDGLEGVAA